MGLQQPWQELPLVQKPLDRINIDLTDMITGTHSYWYVLTVLDHYSRYVKFYPLRYKMTEEVTRQFQTYLHDFGIPSIVILDHGGEFTSCQFKELCQRFRINMAYATPYHPRGNSLSERMHGKMKIVACILCEGHTYKWPYFLGETWSVLSTTVHTMLGQQPHYVFFLRRAPRQVGAHLPEFSEDTNNDALTTTHTVIQKIHREMSKHCLCSANTKRMAQVVEIDTHLGKKCDNCAQI